MNNKGFTLVEVVVSLALLAMTAALFLGIFTSAVSTTTTLGQREQERQRAIAQMERAITDGLAGVPPEIARAKGSITIQFGDESITADGYTLTADGAVYFLADG